MPFMTHEAFERNRESLSGVNFVANDPQKTCDELNDRIVDILNKNTLPKDADAALVLMFKNVRLLFDATEKFESTEDAIEVMRYIEGQLDLIFNGID